MDHKQTQVFLLLFALSVAVPWWLVICRQDRDGVGDRLVRLALRRAAARRRR